MNNGILHGARPSDSQPKGNFGGMPAEVLAMARQMGLTPEDMKQVNSMWKNMDDLAESDPESYRKFTSDIIAEGPPEKGGKPKTFIPDPSFVVKLKTKSNGGTGMKVSTLTGPTKFFLNMTSCNALEPPKDHFGRPMEKKERRPADGLEIPLLVGEVRNCGDHSGDACLAVDAVFHPWVIDSCDDNNTFKAQVIDLAVQWVEQETSYQFEKQWKTIKSKYKGGLGEEESMPMPFPIDRAVNQNDPIDERKEESPGEINDEENNNAPKIPNIRLSTPSPESLLKATMNPVIDQQTNIMMPGEVPKNQTSSQSDAPRKPLIQEVLPTKPSKPVVKKGFLRSNEGKPAPRIYDENGSTGDGSKEGSYSRLMSKCKVVDMSTMTPEEQKKAMDQHAAQEAQTKSQKPPPPPPTPILEEPNSGFASLEKGFLEGKSIGNNGNSKPTKSSDALFDSLISEVDPDFAEATQPTKDVSEDTLSSLGDIARVLAGQPSAEMTESAPQLMKPLKGVDDEAPARVSQVPKYTLDMEVASTGLQVAYVVVPLESELASKVDLQVGASEMRLAIPSKSKLSVPLPFRIDESKTKAKYSKAKGSLKITLTEL